LVKYGTKIQRIIGKHNFFWNNTDDAPPFHNPAAATPALFDILNSQQQLSEHEYMVCLLTRLAFPSVSIDRLTGVSEGYTSRLKSRLFKKLAGKEGNAKDFEHWIMAIK